MVEAKQNQLSEEEKKKQIRTLFKHSGPGKIHRLYSVSDPPGQVSHLMTHTATNNKCDHVQCTAMHSSPSVRYLTFRAHQQCMHRPKVVSNTQNQLETKPNSITPKVFGHVHPLRDNKNSKVQTTMLNFHIKMLKKKVLGFVTALEKNQLQSNNMGKQHLDGMLVL
ncbi:hypothetical protein BgiBS90_000689 [Biomphalaria glabrata]|nr:hypothetical protein BgiBS90_000689 [Biomphalaria glabrata]